MSSIPRLRAALWAAGSLLAATGGMLAAPLAARADTPVTASSITAISGAQSPFVLYDHDADGAGDPAHVNDWTVTGSTNGSGGAVDLVCAEGTAGSSTFASGVPVQPDGTFSATASVGTIERYGTCELRAVPSGTSPSDLTPYAARRVGVDYTETYAVAPGSPYDFYDYVVQDGATADYLSIGGCGLCDMRLTGADLRRGAYLWYDNAALYRDLTPTGGPRRAYAEVDGQPAYVPNTADGINRSATGARPLTHSIAVDPATGDAVIETSEPLVTCATFPATSADCTAWTAVPVTIERTITQDHDGRMVAIVDELRSTDGAAHTYDLQFENYQSRSTSTGPGANGYRFAGDGDYAVRATGDVVPGGEGTSVLQAKRAADTAPSLDNPLGSVTSTPAPKQYEFGDSSGYYANFVGSVPAGGSATIRQTFTMAETQAELDRQIAVAKDGQVAPTVTVDPGPASVDRPGITVSGTAKALGAPATLTVDGAAVPVAADGTWSTALTLRPGANVVTAVATNSAGRTATATRTVTYVPASTTTPTTPTTPATTPTVPTTTATTASPVVTTPVAPAPPAGAAAPAPRTRVTLLSSRRSGATALRVALGCSTEATRRCVGRVSVTAKVRKRGASALTTVKLGSATFDLGPNAARGLTVRLNRTGVAVLRRHRTLQARVKVFVDRGAPTVGKLTLRAG